MSKDPCPCFSQKSYAECCQPYHTDEKSPEAPKQLMRSRYSAFALGKCDYIYKTSSKALLANESLSKEAFIESARAFSEGTDFVGLEIVEAKGDAVTFVAYLKDKASGQDISFKERSAFIIEDGKWVYDSGELSRLD